MQLSYPILYLWRIPAQAGKLHLYGPDILGFFTPLN
jgi:hypothetical protein